MAAVLHVNGTCFVMSRTGAGLTLELLGVSEGGVTVELQQEWSDVNTDLFGPKVPFDKQNMLQKCYISADMVWYDNNVLAKWLLGAPGNSINPAQQFLGGAAWAGDVVVQNNECAGIVLRSTPTGLGLTGIGGPFATTEACWNFPNCVLVDSAKARHGVEKFVYSIKLQALYVPQTSASFDSELFSFTCV